MVIWLWIYFNCQIPCFQCNTVATLSNWWINCGLPCKKLNFTFYMNSVFSWQIVSAAPRKKEKEKVTNTERRTHAHVVSYGSAGHTLEHEHFISSTHTLSTRLHPPPNPDLEGRGVREADMEPRCRVVPQLLIQTNVLCSTERLRSIGSVARRVFAHIYYSLCSRIAQLCCILNIKRSAIRRNVFDPGRNTLCHQTAFMSKRTQLNNIQYVAYV